MDLILGYEFSKTIYVVVASLLCAGCFVTIGYVQSRSWLPWPMIIVFGMLGILVAAIWPLLIVATMAVGILCIPFFIGHLIGHQRTKRILEWQAKNPPGDSSPWPRNDFTPRPPGDS